jgi:hypothetical protein
MINVLGKPGAKAVMATDGAYEYMEKESKETNYRKRDHCKVFEDPLAYFKTVIIVITR